MTTSIKKFLVFLLIILVQFLFISPQKAYAATTTVDLGTASNFAVLAGSQVVDSNISVISGNVGLSPAGWGASPALVCDEVTGTIYSVDDSGPLCKMTDAGLLTTAKNNLTTAYGDAAGRTPAITLTGSDNQLGGQTLIPGVYTFSHASTANLIGTLTLDTQGDPNAVFVFQTGANSDLVTASDSTIQFVNGETCNVFWQVGSSATLGTGTHFIGTIMADQSITDNGGSTVNGRFLVSIAAVTLNNTHITKSTCTAAAPTPTPLSCSSDQHLDAAGLNCVSWSQSNPPENGGTTTTTSTGQVLGASTLASTGSFNSNAGLALMIIGSVMTLGSLYAFKKRVI